MRLFVAGPVGPHSPPGAPSEVLQLEATDVYQRRMSEYRMLSPSATPSFLQYVMTQLRVSGSVSDGGLSWWGWRVLIGVVFKPVMWDCGLDDRDGVRCVCWWTYENARLLVGAGGVSEG